MGRNLLIVDLLLNFFQKWVTIVVHLMQKPLRHR